jgi:hypothetical protein
MGLSQSTSQGQERGSASIPIQTTTTNTTVTGSSSAYNANFQQKLVDSSVYPYGYEYSDGRIPPLPDNWKEINNRLAQPRPSLSSSTFPEEEYEKFVRADARASNEDAVKDSVIPAMLSAIGSTKGTQKNTRFTNHAPLTGKKNELKDARPDYYYGAQPEQLHQDVRNNLSKHIIPIVNQSSHLAKLLSRGKGAEWVFGGGWTAGML